MIKIEKIIVGFTKCPACDLQYYFSFIENDTIKKCKNKCLNNHSYEPVLKVIYYDLENEIYKYTIKVYINHFINKTLIYQLNKNTNISVDFLTLNDRLLFESISELENLVFL